MDPNVLHAGFIYDNRGRGALRGLYGQYLDVGSAFDLPMVICTPTWRGNPIRLRRAGLADRDVNGDGVRFVASIRDEYGTYAKRVFIGGLVGCMGDAYKPEEGLSVDDAARFHGAQTEALAAAGADFLLAATLPNGEEARGIAIAMAGCQVTYVLSFVLRRDGRLLDGTHKMVDTDRLAINGGPKAITRKLTGWPSFDEKAIRAVEEVLRSGKVNYWTGRKGMEFENKFAQWQGSRYAISTATGTAALHVGLSTLGIGPGDEVIVPSHTFIATSFAVVQAGAIPRFADVNLEDHCISLESAERLVNDRTRAIMPVHLYGNVCDMDQILTFAKKHGLFVVEDNAEAFGGAYKGRKTGTIGDLAGCSFCPNKTFTTGGEGGMVTTESEELAWRARSFRDHGYDVQERLGLLELEQKLPYIHNMVGWNYRMTEMQSAIGLAELERMDTWNLPTRRRNAYVIINALKQTDALLPSGKS